MDVREAKNKMFPFYVKLVSIGSLCVLDAVPLRKRLGFDKSGRSRVQNQIASFYVNKFSQKKFAQIGS